LTDYVPLRVRPCELRDANEFVALHHRHHNPVQQHRFSLACVGAEDRVHGVAIVGRPLARMLDTGLVVEVIRLATDGTRNACSMLYGAAARAARELGYDLIVTYVLASESGTSLKAAGWTCDGEAGGGSWSRPSRPRPVQLALIDGSRHAPATEAKVRWSKRLRSA